MKAPTIWDSYMEGSHKLLLEYIASCSETEPVIPLNNCISPNWTATVLYSKHIF